MKIKFNLDCIKPMIDWLLESKKNNVRDENKLREILNMPDYKIEFARYGSPNIPVCGINLEEAVDFFLNFDKKDFKNERLQYKKESFLTFYNEIEKQLKTIDMITSISEHDYDVIETLVKNSLPDEATKDIPELNIILIVSIGNSMGWPYDHYIDYDIANLNMFETMEDFLHVTAHEINHLFVGQMLAPEGIKPEDFFLQNFAFEGLAVHYNNNLKTLYKDKKYDDDITYGMVASDMEFYERNFDKIFEMIKADYYACRGKQLEEVADLVSSHYEIFEFMGKKIQQYPTYYFGCYMWGLVDLRYGKEKLYEAIEKPELFVQLYNSVAQDKYRL